jgi:hypothetical protein
MRRLILASPLWLSPALLAQPLFAEDASRQEPTAAPKIAYSPVLVPDDATATATPPGSGRDTAAVGDIAPADERSSGGSGIPHIEVFQGGKLLLTNGITTVEGPSGGGIATWATIGGREMGGGIGISGNVTAIELPDFGWRSFGGAIGVGDRIELSYQRQSFDTRTAGAALGLGEGYTFNQEIYGAKLRLLGDAVYGPSMLPQFALGVEYKRNLDGPVIALLGASDDESVDYTFSATKLLLEHSLLVNATARLTKANQLGLLGFGSAQDGYQLQFEGSLAYMLSRRAVIGAEYRSKPDNLGLGEDDWMDIFAAYALTKNITLTAAYVDLGSIATFEDQRGGYLQAQVAF